MSYLKTKKVYIESLERDVELVELNVKGESEMLQAHKEGQALKAAAITVKYGCTQWRESDVDQIMEELPRRIVQEISGKVLDLSGGEEKNSESTPDEDSSSA